MPGFGRGLFRGLLAGGVVAVLWGLLGERRIRIALATRLMRGIEGIPFPGTRIYALLIAPAMNRVYRAVAADLAPEVRSGELMELGCGPGDLAVEIAQRARNLEITALDISMDMVALAEGKARSAGLGRQIKVVHGDAAEIPYPEGSFDFVVSLASLHHWRSPERVFSEIHRILRPGGRAWIYDLRREMAQQDLDRLTSVFPFLLRPLSDMGLTVSWQEAYDEAQLRRIVPASPFGVATVEPLWVDIAGSRIPALTKTTLRKEAEAPKQQASGLNEKEEAVAPPRIRRRGRQRSTGPET